MTTKEEILKGCEHDGSFIPVNEVKRAMQEYADQQTAPLQAIIDRYHQSDVTQAKYDIKAETLERIIEKQGEIIEAKNKLIEFAEAPQYHEIMTAKSIQKVVIISLESELAALQAGEAKDDNIKEDMVVTVEQRTINILLDDTFSGHPSREESYQQRNAIKFLAQQIDVLHTIRIKG